MNALRTKHDLEKAVDIIPPQYLEIIEIWRASGEVMRLFSCSKATILISLLVGSMFCRAGDLPLAPGQPISGPGGRDYPYGAAVITNFKVSTSFGPMTYTVYEPGFPKPASAPVLAFIMGNWFPANSSATHILYGALYTHLARKGYIVIHPDNNFQNKNVVAAGTTINDADEILSQIIKAALVELQSGSGRVRPAKDASGILFALGGHSMGGLLAQIVADSAATKGLPIPRALALEDATPRDSLEPNPSDPLDYNNLALPSAWNGVPPSTKLLQTISFESIWVTYGLEPLTMGQYMVWQTADMRRMFVNVPNENHTFLSLSRDARGTPSLESTELSLIASNDPALNAQISHLLEKYVNPILLAPYVMYPVIVDAMDYYARWKHLEALLNYSLRGQADQRRFVFPTGDTQDATYMGRWSDGVPVRRSLWKSSYPTWEAWFDPAQPFTAKPTSPDGLWISGYPKILFQKDSVKQKVFFASYGPDTPVIKKWEFLGTGGQAFHLSQDPKIGMNTIECRTDLGSQTSILKIDYDINGTTQTVTREIQSIVP